MRIYLLVALLCALPMAACAPEQVSPSTPAGANGPARIAIRAARLFDGRSDTLVTGVTVLVEGTTIKAVGKDLAVPPDAALIELGDATLLPGFIDAHVHLASEASE